MVAILLWSTSIACTRGVVEQLGVIRAGAITQLLGGSVGLLYLAATGQLTRLRCLPRRYLVGGSLLVTGYLVCLYLALGMAASGRQVIDVGLINYLWPGLTLLLSVPLLHRRARPWLLPGLLVAFAGVVLALFPTGAPTWRDFLTNAHAHSAAYLLALVAAVLWALYSNLSRRWAAEAPISAMPLFVFIAGVVMALLGAVRPVAPVTWTLSGVLATVYVALGPTLLGYVLWDYGMQRGRHALLANLANFIPLFSTLVSSVYFHLPLGPHLWTAVALLIAGAAICNTAIVER